MFSQGAQLNSDPSLISVQIRLAQWIKWNTIPGLGWTEEGMGRVLCIDPFSIDHYSHKHTLVSESTYITSEQMLRTDRRPAMERLCIGNNSIVAQMWSLNQSRAAVQPGSNSASRQFSRSQGFGREIFNAAVLTLYSRSNSAMLQSNKDLEACPDNPQRRPSTASLSHEGSHDPQLTEGYWLFGITVRKIPNTISLKCVYCWPWNYYYF